MPTYMMTHWARDRSRGEKLPLEWVVKRQTRDTADLYGLCDRGSISPGMKADVNVIDFERLAVTAPEVVFDLPASGRRLIQKSRGYVFTILSWCGDLRGRRADWCAAGQARAWCAGGTRELRPRRTAARLVS